MTSIECSPLYTSAIPQAVPSIRPTSCCFLLEKSVEEVKLLGLKKKKKNLEIIHVFFPKQEGN